MKTTTKTAIATAVALAIGCLGLAGTGYASGSKGDRQHGFQANGEDHRGSRHGKHRRARHVEHMLERFDSDGDGRMTQAEIDQARARQLATFDQDGSATLTLDEFQALWLEVARERMVDHFQHLDSDGDGVVTGTEFNKRTGKLVSRIDRNGDGVISLEDMRRGHHGNAAEAADND